MTERLRKNLGELGSEQPIEDNPIVDDDEVLIAEKPFSEGAGDPPV